MVKEEAGKNMEEDTTSIKDKGITDAVRPKPGTFKNALTARSPKASSGKMHSLPLLPVKAQ